MAWTAQDEADVVQHWGVEPLPPTTLAAGQDGRQTAIEKLKARNPKAAARLDSKANAQPLTVDLNTSDMRAAVNVARDELNEFVPALRTALGPDWTNADDHDIRTLIKITISRMIDTDYP